MPNFQGSFAEINPKSNSLAGDSSAPDAMGARPAEQDRLLRRLSPLHIGVVALALPQLLRHVVRLPVHGPSNPLVQMPDSKRSHKQTTATLFPLAAGGGYYRYLYSPTCLVHLLKKYRF
jgi:hypothetical protein